MPGQSFDDANAFHRMMRRFASTKVGVALLRPTAHHLDRLITRVTGGRSSFAGVATGVPVVMLTTTGAKSGEPRTIAVYGIPHPDGLGLIASNFGGVKHPAWYFNLKANPEATVTIGRDTWHANARLATPSERDEIWAKGARAVSGLAEVRSAGRQAPHRGVRPGARLRRLSENYVCAANPTRLSSGRESSIISCAPNTNRDGGGGDGPVAFCGDLRPARCCGTVVPGRTVRRERQ